jgi:hypothetical protein
MKTQHMRRHILRILKTKNPQQGIFDILAEAVSAI